MPRRPYGPSADTRAEDAAGNAIPGAHFRFYTDELGGLQYNDLQWADGTSVTEGIIPADEYGYPPPFLSDPTGPGYMWADAGGGRRVRVYALDIADRLDTAEAGLATATATLGGLGATTAGIRARGNPIYDVRGYGTDGAAVQQALNAARDNGGGVVFVPPGTYPVTTTLRIYTNTTLHLAPGSVLQRAANITLLVNGDDSQSLGGYTGHGFIRITGGGTVDMQGTVWTNANNGLSFGHAQNITLDNITIKDEPSNHHLELNAIKTATVLNVKFLGYSDVAAIGGGYKEAIQIDLAKDAASARLLPYDHTTCEDILIQGCTFAPSGTAGTTAPNCAMGGHSGTIGVRHRNIRFIGNHCEGLLFWAVSGYAITGLTVTGNTFLSCDGGVRSENIRTTDPDDTLNTAGVQTAASQDERGTIISNNTFLDTVGLGDRDVIKVIGEATGKTLGVTITGNIIDGATNGARAINCAYAERANITGNSIYNTNGSGIYLDNCHDSIVQGNIERVIGGTGILATTCTGLVIANNNIRSANNDAINIAASDIVTVTGNVIRLAGQNGIHILTSTSDFTVTGNVVRGASRNTSNTYSAFKTSASATRGTWSGNRAYRHGSGVEYKNGFEATNTTTNMKLYGNVWQAGVSAALNNASTTQDNTATDLTVA